MAVAARPGPSDARVPCPLCGGLIHPIAGKCKHCKADLTAHRTTRPAANAPLPALNPASGENGHANGHAGTHARHAPAAHAVPLPIATGDAPLPVLPPRPTGPSYPTDLEPRVPGWRSWPMVVIILATLAIVTAVALMVWPARAGRPELDGKHPIVPPAPERMQTEPDVRSQPQAAPQIQPKPSPPATPPGATPDPGGAPADPASADPNASATDPDDDDHDVTGSIDPFASPRPGAPSVPPSRRHLPFNGTGAVWFAIAEHMCRRLEQCGTDDPIGKRACTKISRGRVPSPIGCPAADRCLQHIDTMSCGSMDIGLAQLSLLLNQFRECTDALGC
jgi:hypothetical protein